MLLMNLGPLRRKSQFCKPIDQFDSLNIEKVGIFTCTDFKTYFWDGGITLSLVATDKQSQKHYAECSWQMVHSLSPCSFLSS